MTVLGGSSSAVVLTAAITAVSGTLIFLALHREQSLANTQLPNSSKTLRSCLNSDGRRKKKKKRVRFAETVRDQSGNGEKYRKKERRKPKSCRWSGNQQNRVALCSGILRDRVKRMETETVIF